MFKTSQQNGKRLNPKQFSVFAKMPEPRNRPAPRQLFSTKGRSSDCFPACIRIKDTDSSPFEQGDEGASSAIFNGTK